MKQIYKTLSILSTLLLFTTIISAQPRLGIFGGLNSSALRGDSPDRASYKSLMGGNFGVYLDLKLSEAVSLSFQPSYSQEGTRVFYTVSKVEEPVDSLSIRLNYISLPVLVKISTANQKWYAISGIEAGYLLDSFIKSGDTQEDINADVAQYNIAIHFGAGFRIPFKFGRMFIELRYSQGLVNLTDGPIEKSYVPRVKTSGFKVLIGYEIPLSKKEK